MRQLALGIGLLLTCVSGAHAFCTQSRGYDTTSFINGAVQYLICLHNEQGDSISSLTQTLNHNADAFNGALRSMDAMEAELSTLRLELSTARAKVGDLERQVSMLQTLVYSLSTRLEAVE